HCDSQISIASLLPNMYVTYNPAISRSGYSGSNYDAVIPIAGTPSFLQPRNVTTRSYTLALQATQTVFNFAQSAGVAQSLATAKGADATLNAALQSLMTRVENAYFAILKDEDNLSYTKASKRAYEKQLDQVNQQYKVGLKTLTDVYTAQASYDSAYATEIAAQTALTNDKENLRVITGKYYEQLLPLSDDFPLVSPQPLNEEEWVRRAQLQNWNIRTAQYNVDSNRQIIRQQYAGHLPIVTAQASVSRAYTDNLNGYPSFNLRNGPGTETDKTFGFNVTMPLFSGGSVVAQTNQAVYNYQIAQQQLEQTARNTINTTRQSYLNVVAGISLVKADKQAIKSATSSWEGLEASYRVGTETLVDVLNQQQRIFQAQTTYATDRYAFINNIFLLKQAAGTLCFDDLRGLNAWLITNKKISPSK
ncbi:MAG: TolC family outer membrane protein, partial [Gammaproteobacteria bacterium]